MKKLIASLIITATALSANAADSSDVVGALILGGILGSAINDNNQQKQPRQDVYVYPGTQNYPIYVPSPVYTPPRTWSPNPVYELLPVYDPSCNCHVLMPVRVR